MGNWKITLPVFPPEPVLDTSTILEYARCPRRGLYRYGMRRGFDGKSYPIQYGLAFHKYRELLELEIKKEGELTFELHEKVRDMAMEGYENPPIGHRHAYLDEARLETAINLAYVRVKEERESGNIIVTRSEDAFDLELPFRYCEECGTTFHDDGWEKDTHCPYCLTPELIRARHGGRVDQFIQFKPLRNAHMIRDFKTTSRMGKNYAKKFDPNAQMMGYVWAGSELSGRKFDGALIETIYNTKSTGPAIYQHYVTFTPQQIDAWKHSMMIEHQQIRTMWSRVEELGYLAFPQRTSACDDFGGCSFRDACRTSSPFELERWIENYTIESHWDFTDPEGEDAAI